MDAKVLRAVLRSALLALELSKVEIKALLVSVSPRIRAISFASGYFSIFLYVSCQLEGASASSKPFNPASKPRSILLIVVSDLILPSARESISSWRASVARRAIYSVTNGNWLACAKFMARAGFSGTRGSIPYQISLGKLWSSASSAWVTNPAAISQRLSCAMRCIAEAK